MSEKRCEEWNRKEEQAVEGKEEQAAEGKEKQAYQEAAVIRLINSAGFLRM